MKIFTTYFGALRKLPKNIIPISIATQPIPGWTGLQYSILAPGWELISKYKQTQNWDDYTKSYLEKLQKLSKEQVFNDLKTLSNGNDVALVCYERPEDNCHRYLVAEWLGDVEEYTFEEKIIQKSLFDEIV